MSSVAHARPKGASTRLVQGTVLVLLCALLFFATRAAPQGEGPMAAIAAVGFLLLAGTLASELLEPLGMPHLTGYLLAGIVSGPYVLRLLDHETVGSLKSVNGLALALIALEGGAELRIENLRRGLRSLVASTLIQTLFVIVVVTATFALARPIIPFVRGLPTSALLGAALLWGCTAITRSPSATLGILSQTRATGPLATFTLNFVMASDVVVVVVLAAAMMVARPLLEPGASFSLHEVSRLGHEILGSVALGTTLGLIVAAYLRLIGRQMIVVLLALGFGMTEVMKYLRLDPLLGFMIAGFVVQNLSRQGHRFLQEVARTGGIVYVVFFATAGADLDVPTLRSLGPVALLLTSGRAAATVVAGRLAARAAGDPPLLRTWSWSGLVSQAGLALGFGMLVSQTFPVLGRGYGALTVATVAINEMVGPILFKLALDRAGETSSAEPAMRASVPPPPT